MKLRGIKPYEHQKAVIDELREAKGTGKIVVCNSSRQKGKSYMVSNLLLFYAINYQRTNNYCVTPTLKQARNIYKLIVDAIVGSRIIKKRNASELFIELVNGSVIAFKSAEQREGLRGYTADFVVIDEAAFIPDEIFYLILPWVDAKKAPLLLCSTPFIKQGFFYKYFCYGKDEDNPNIVTIDWSEEKFKESIQQILSEEKLEEYRRTLPLNVFRTEYLGEFLDGDGSVFTNIRSNVQDTPIKAEDKLYVGIDWANGVDGDYTVISVFNERGEQVLLRYFNRISTTRQIEKIVEQLEPIIKQVQVIYCESNSIGTPMTEMLKEKSQILTNLIREFTTTNSSKADIVTKMQVALEQGKVKLLPDEKQLNEFGFYTATYNQRTRNVTYNAPSGLHDDTVMATLIAYNGLDAAARVGVYSIGFYRHKKPYNRFDKFNHS